MRSYCLLGRQFQFYKMKMSYRDGCWWWLHNSVNLFNAHWIFKSGKDGKFCYMYFIKIFLKIGKKNQTLKRRPILLQKFSFSFLFEQYSISGGFHLLPRKCFPHTEDFQIASYSKSQLKKIFWWSQINVVKELISYRL